MSWARLASVHVYQGRVDFRKSWNGLLAEALKLGVDPYQGAAVVFVHPSRKALKILGGDGMGLWILMRRFEAGRLEMDFPMLLDTEIVEISRGELELLLEGAKYELQKRSRPWLRKSTLK